MGDRLRAGLTALSLDGISRGQPEVDPTGGVISLGSTPALNNYIGSISQQSFGTGGFTRGASASGPGITIATDTVAVPNGYSSGTQLGTSTATWDNTTLAGLGVIDGTYIWSWGSVADNDYDTFTLNIGQVPVPEPASLALLGTAVAAVGFTRFRRSGRTG